MAAVVLAAGIPPAYFAIPSIAAAQTPAQLGSHVRCAGFEVVTDQTSPIMPEVGPARLRVMQGARPMWTLPDADAGPITSVTCRDATGDRISDLLVERYSGGAHCCTTLHIATLVPSIRLVLRYQAGNAGGFDIVDLNHDGRPELVLGDDSFAYFDDLCYACSPSEMPLIACFQDGRFVDCARSFPGKVREGVTVWSSRLREEIKQGPSAPGNAQYIRGAALGLYATYALLGEEAKGRAAVHSIVPTSAVLAWLDAHRVDVRKWISARGAKLR